MRKAPAAKTPSIPQGSWSACSSFTATTVTSSRKSNESSSSQEEEDSPASSYSSPDAENLPVDPLDEKTVVLVQFLLHKYQIREPVREAGMLNNVINENKNDFHEMVRRASEHMELVFGVSVKEIDPISHRYVLVNKLGLTNDDRLSGDEGIPKTTILIIVPGAIFIKGNCAPEDEIWEVLNTMNLYSGRKIFIFGEPVELITRNLVQENYLEYCQVRDIDPSWYEFQ
ncbi:Melanoma-associated antigen B10 [Sciurus carolinensis]|uniref:Melanoma-associated antigen B10 n=1 Tax=Sciurus carolinensis TaxID=30640 RepID=A0AA41MCZ5_SCICA|nr:Melanoma-associated antigen B10 [Sciurus carolinensis]